MPRFLVVFPEPLMNWLRAESRRTGQNVSEIVRQTLELRKRKIMTVYELFLHFKQGDDLSRILGRTKTPSAALTAWAETFEHHRRVCLEIAQAIDGKRVRVDADTHTITLTPEDADAKRALDALVERKLITLLPIEEEA